MKIEIKIIPHAAQRYPTLGDWFFEPRGNILKIRISRCPDRRAEIGLIVHELVEALLCEHNGVTEREVDAWDLTHLDDPDPGSNPNAPYHSEHMTATAAEKTVIDDLSLSWQKYEEILKSVEDYQNA